MPRHRATAGSYEGGGSDERGIPVFPEPWTPTQAVRGGDRVLLHAEIHQELRQEQRARRARVTALTHNPDYYLPIYIYIYPSIYVSISIYLFISLCVVC